MIVVPVIDAADADNDVAEGTLGVVRDAGLRHERPRRASQVMNDRARERDRALDAIHDQPNMAIASEPESVRRDLERLRAQ